MNRKKAAWIIAVILWALLLAPFFLGASAAHPATDDFTFAVYTHPTWLATGSLPHVIKDALSYTLRTWRDWQGTATGVLIMALNPAVFTIRYYGVHAVILLLLQLIADFVFLRHMLGRRLRLPRETWAALYLSLSAMRLIFLPDIVEGIYWFNGAWFYTGAQAVALLTLTLADVWSEANARRAAQIMEGVFACGLLFALGMDNYITAMMTAAALFMMAMQRVCAARRSGRTRGCVSRIRWEQDGSYAVLEERTFGGEAEKAAYRRAAIRTALLLIPICAGLLLSIAAPGNAVRMAADGAHESGMDYALLSFARTAQAAAGYLLRFLLRTPLLCALLLATPFLSRALDRTPELGRRCPPVWATLAGLYLILCAMIVPHMYASGYAGSGRVVNMYHDYVLLAAPIAWTMILARLKQKARMRLAGAKGACAVLFMIALAVWLAGGQLGNYVKLARDQVDGTQQAYIAQFQNEYALCEAAGEEDDVLLPAWTVQTVTGKPTAYADETVWTNEAMAQYFGVKSVRVEE